MQPYSDYEIAQRRIEDRQIRKTQFRTSLFILVTAIFVSIIGGSANVCSIPIAFLAFICAIILRINLYYTAPENAPSTDEIDQEITWLLGENQVDFLNMQIRVLAQDRILKRGIRKWRFFAHLLLFIPINGGIFLIGLQTLAHDTSDSNIVFGFLALVFVAAWLVILISDFQGTFPNQQHLENQEKIFGQTLQFEIARLHAAKPKEKEKLKRRVRYVIADDGELEEVEDEALILEDKPKRESGGAL